MIKLIDNKSDHPEAKTKPMYQMQPLEVCVVVSSDYTGNVVMRTASSNHFEVMNLTKSVKDGCWRHDPNLQVRELYPGETYTLELS